MEIPISERFMNFILPKHIRIKEHITLKKAGINEPKDKLYFSIIISEFIISLIAFGFILYKFNVTNIIHLIVSPILLVLAFLIVLTVTVVSYLVYLEFKIYNRVKKMEENIPRFLEILSINLRSGLNLNNALLNSTNPEFGPLHEEIKLILKESETGKSIEDAILEFTHKYNSPLLSEVFELIVTSYSEGGKTSFLTETMVKNLNNSNYLKKMVVASVMSYVIFIALVSLVLAPMLFALSFNLLSLTQSLISRLLVTGTAKVLPQMLTNIRLEADDFILFSRMAILVVALSAAAITSIIQKNSIKAGYKYIIIFSVIASLSYQFFLWTFTLLFKTVFSTVML